jgi:hypothetical protein
MEPDLFFEDIYIDDVDNVEPDNVTMVFYENVLSSIPESNEESDKESDKESDDGELKELVSEKIPEIVFIVPYRDREIHYRIFSDTMRDVLKNSCEYKILYIHQKDDRSFNRGAMKNIGFLMVKQMYPLYYKNITLVFNDIDTMPSKSIQLDYKTTVGTIKHFYGFDYTLGGIVSVAGYDFENLNGFPNFWAWGFEDNLLYTRAKQNNINVDRSVFYKIHDPRIIHLVDSPIRTVNRTEYDRFLQNTTEGIRSITDLKYEVNENTGFIDVLEFNTTVDEIVEKRVDYDLRNGPAPFKNMNMGMKPRRMPTMKMHF